MNVVSTARPNILQLCQMFGRVLQAVYPKNKMLPFSFNVPKITTTKFPSITNAIDLFNFDFMFLCGRVYAHAILFRLWAGFSYRTPD